MSECATTITKDDFKIALDTLAQNASGRDIQALILLCEKTPEALRAGFFNGPLLVALDSIQEADPSDLDGLVKLKGISEEVLLKAVRGYTEEGLFIIHLLLDRDDLTQGARSGIWNAVFEIGFDSDIGEGNADTIAHLLTYTDFPEEKRNNVLQALSAALENPCSEGDEAARHVLQMDAVPLDIRRKAITLCATMGELRFILSCSQDEALPAPLQKTAADLIATVINSGDTALYELVLASKHESMPDSMIAQLEGALAKHLVPEPSRDTAESILALRNEELQGIPESIRQLISPVIERCRAKKAEENAPIPKKVALEKAKFYVGQIQDLDIGGIQAPQPRKFNPPEKPKTGPKTPRTS
jgi:hypothetical protein